MATFSLIRRLTSKNLHHFLHTSPIPKTLIQSPIPKTPKTLIFPIPKTLAPNPLQFPNPRSLSTSIEKPIKESPIKDPDFKNQEIEGPTVDRDLSSLANETREVLDSMMKTIYDLSKVLGVLGLVQLGYGAWVAYVMKDVKMIEVSVMSVVAFGFPFSVAFLIRRSVKDMRFFEKMEGIGRLQLMTSTMQIAKSLNLLFVRVRGFGYLCIGGLVSGFLFVILSR